MSLWGIKPQTGVKHRLLIEYFGRWFPILSQRLRTGGRVVYIDGFSGPGRYSGGEPGSPILALDAAINHPRFSRLLELPNFEMVFMFIDKDPDACANLTAELDAWRDRVNPPQQIRIIGPIAGEFNEHLRQALAVLGEGGKTLAPSLAFIDPFGPLGLQLDTLRSILRNRSCEVLIRFNYTRLANNFMRRPDMHSRVNEMFGTSEWKNSVRLDASNREEAILDLYANQLRAVAGAKFVQRFRTADPGGRVAHFIFCTNNSRGFEEMKESMWKVDPTGEFRWNARSSTPFGQSSFLGSLADSSCERDLSEALAAAFAGKTVGMKEVEEFVRCQPDWLIRHLRPGLRLLEDARRILEVTKPGGTRRKHTYPLDSTIRFA
jgi:three-Cys-motif partner protein